MKRIVSIAAALLLCASIFSLPTTRAQNPRFTTIDFPGAAFTVANEVNENGDIVGVYRMATSTGGLSQPRGFLLNNGQFTTVHKSGAAFTRAYGINNAGDIVGDYSLGGVLYGFLLRAGSTEFQTIQYTDGAFASTNTDAWGIDDQGQITGGFVRQGIRRAYVWHDGVFTRVLEAPFSNHSIRAYTHGVNSRGEVVGCYWRNDDGEITMHSLRVTPEGDYLTENFPDSMGMSMHWRITESSLIVGHYDDMDGVGHGYLYKNGEYEAIDFPDAIRTEAHGVAERQLFNRAGQPLGARQLLIVGPYVDSNGVTHGYLFTRQIGVGQGEVR